MTLTNELHICTGCGACFALCPLNAITMQLSAEGVYRPLINRLKCKECGLCKKVCPSFSINNQISLRGLGEFIGCYAGYSADEHIRWKSSSGGLATTILCALLDDGLIDGAVVLTENTEDPLSPLMSFVNNDKEIREPVRSKYCPVRTNFKITDLISRPGKIAVVGLPCHIWAFKNLEKINVNLKEKVLIHIGLFCGKTPNFYATEFFIKKKTGTSKKNVSKISYRGMGWPGPIAIETKQGSCYTFRYAEWLNFSYYPHFIPIRCVLCFDISNQFSDLSIGDAWGLSKDKVGTSIVITRSPVGEALIQGLLSKRKLVLHAVESSEVVKGQGLEEKMQNSKIRTYLWKTVFNQPVPSSEFTSKVPSATLKAWLSNFIYCSLLYASKYRFVRILLCNCTPHTLKFRSRGKSVG